MKSGGVRLGEKGRKRRKRGNAARAEAILLGKQLLMEAEAQRGLT